jgi:hypothetical protein
MGKRRTDAGGFDAVRKFDAEGLGEGDVALLKNAVEELDEVLVDGREWRGGVDVRQCPTRRSIW